jgi:hypothetical protein
VRWNCAGRTIPVREIAGGNVASARSRQPSVVWSFTSRIASMYAYMLVEPAKRKPRFFGKLNHDGPACVSFCVKSSNRARYPGLQ